jgi:uncharacterized protein (TIGR01777 family)
VHELLRSGHQVTVLSRDPAAAARRLPSEARAVWWDGRSSEGWIEEAGRAEAIINLAAENIAGSSFLPQRWDQARKELIRQSRRDSAGAVVEAITRSASRPAIVIQASAVGYYGPREDVTLDESGPPGDDFLAETVLEWEAAMEPVRDLGVRLALIRTGLILTEKGGPLSRLLPFFKLFVGGPYGSGRQWWSWIHIRDEVRAIRFLMESESSEGPYNLTAPEPVRNREFARTLGKVLGRPSLIPVPAPAMRLLVGEVATVVLTGQRVIPARLSRAGFRFVFPHLEGALRNLLQTEESPGGSTYETDAI